MITIEYLDYEIPVYDITVADTHNFFANGILVHNCLEIAAPTADLTEFSNLRTEVAKDTGLYSDDMSMEQFRSRFGEINLCTLSAINWGNIKKPEDFERVCHLALRALDNLITYQDYPMIAAHVPAINRRNLGVGIINLAHFLATQNVKYGEEKALELVDTYAEAMYYYLMKANVQLAKERGPCGWYKDTHYSDGVFIHELRNTNVDSLIPHNPKMDWESLRADMIKYGVRNSQVVALMPSETSAVISNATNGIEPPRKIITVKTSKDSVMKQLVPKPKLKYDFLWDQPTPVGYIKTVAVLQKYNDQSISANTSYNPDNFNGPIPMTQLLQDILMCYKFGVKTAYYHNTMVEMTDDITETKSEESDCESCKI
jgi:ribonucleoside-diphosphate reductase alpha chain